jgi:antitoxin ParD1/3/4
MQTLEHLSIALPGDTISALNAAVASGEYGNASEVIQAALQAWEIRRKTGKINLAEIQHFVLEGVQSGPGIDSDLVFRRLRAKYSSMKLPDDV